MRSVTSTSSALSSNVRVREVWAWSMYDFANSGYTTVVITAVFGAFFVSVVAQNKPWATYAKSATSLRAAIERLIKSKS